MKDILNGCKRLGISFDDTIERLAELYDFLQKAENARKYDENVSWAALDTIIVSIKAEIAEDEKKLEAFDDNPPTDSE